MKRRVLVVLASFGVVACSPPKSTAYFTAHSKELGAQVERCALQQDDPHGQLCRNAAQAYYEANGVPARNGEPTR